MLVRCIKGDGNILKEGETYFVYHVTRQGNFLLSEVDPPKGFNCFDASRFEFIDDMTVEEEAQFWEEQPSSYTGA